MTRRLRRLNELEVDLQIKDDAFIRPPREAQRNWLLNRALKEFTDDLTALDTVARTFVSGATRQSIADRTRQILDDRTQKPLDDGAIMEDWQIPMMRAMAEIVGETRGDILEVGFGRGVSATFIQEHDVRSHTIVECNDSVVERYHAWKAGYPERDIRLLHGKWQDVTDRMAQYDGVFFHTYPLNEEEFLHYVSQSVTFAEHFFPTAAAHLRPGGVFTYLTNEIDSFSRAHQRLVFRYFRELGLRIVPLDMPEDVEDAWWADTMVAVKAVK